ncbi:MAG TPA: hypothetical protein VIP05_33730 [Burkholderiaceae bacterium]
MSSPGTTETTCQLTAGQRHAIECTDAWMAAAGLPTYTELLSLTDQLTRPLPHADTVDIDPNVATQRPATVAEGENDFHLDLSAWAGDRRARR